MTATGAAVVACITGAVLLAITLAIIEAVKWVWRMIAWKS